MSKTYEALRKAEEARMPLPEALNVPGAMPNDAPGSNGAHAKSNGSKKNGAQATRLEYETIRVWLKNPVAHGQRLRTVMVIACHSGTGSTTTAGLLATTLARGRKSRVLIMDTNFRTPGVNLFFRVRDDGEVPIPDDLPLEGTLHATDHENLFVLTSDHFTASPIDAFEGEVFEDLFEEMKKRFDFIVLDAPPALDFPDAYALAPKVDGIILVAEAETTLIEDAQRAKRDLERAGGRVLGVVMNRQTDFLPGFIRRFVAR